MSYLVLARKWRPRSFDTLVGQEHVVRALTHALTTQRLHHAWLFTGTRGVGKTTLSRILAKSLNCETGITPTPCGKCRACTEIDSGRFVDYLELDAASNRGVDEMTQLLEQAVYSPTVGRFKVYMIDEVHMLTGHAFNAMLKTLEEPPPHVKFILATTDPQKIPVTVLSRCLQFNLKQMPPEAIVGHLSHVLAEERIPFETPALRLIGQAARGSMRDALSLTDQAIAFSAGNLSDEAVRTMLGTIDQRHLVRLLDAIADGDGRATLAVADELATRSLSYAGALADLAVLLSQIAIAQRIAGASSPDDPLAADIARLAARLAPDAVQLFYSIAVHSRSELALAPDEYAGFVMACLRMLAFTAEAEGVTRAAPAGGEATAAPMPAAVAAPAAAATAPAQASVAASAEVSRTGAAASNAMSAVSHGEASTPDARAAASASDASIDASTQAPSAPEPTPPTAAPTASITSAPPATASSAPPPPVASTTAASDSATTHVAAAPTPVAVPAPAAFVEPVSAQPAPDSNFTAPLAPRPPATEAGYAAPATPVSMDEAPPWSVSEPDDARQAAASAPASAYAEPAQPAAGTGADDATAYAPPAAPVASPADIAAPVNSPRAALAAAMAATGKTLPGTRGAAAPARPAPAAAPTPTPAPVRPAPPEARAASTAPSAPAREPAPAPARQAAPRPAAERPAPAPREPDTRRPVDDGPSDLEPPPWLMEDAEPSFAAPPGREQPAERPSARPSAPLRTASPASALRAVTPVDPDEPFPPTSRPVAAVPPVEAPASRPFHAGGALKMTESWPDLAARLPVRGIAAQLARQSELVRIDGNQMILRVATRTLSEGQAVDRLRAVLEDHFGQPVRISIEVGATGDETAHAVDAAERSARQQAAEEAILADPFVRALLDDFGGQIVPNSIRPVSPDTP